MSTEVFESRQERLASAIDQAVDKLRAVEPLALPGVDAPLVARCVERIQGDYDVTRAKRDTDHAVDLLYIAYNATPQGYGKVRATISAIMGALISAQKDSQLGMRRAIKAAGDINDMLVDTFPDWLDMRQPVVAGTADAAQVEELRSFVKKDLIGVARYIQNKATEIQKNLLDLAKAYDKIIEDTELATKDSELALSLSIEQRKALQREIAQNNAQREKLEALVADLRAEVEKFDRMAKDFEKKAETAEERAFVMSIVRVAATVVSAIIPPIAMLASGSLGAASRSTGSTREDDTARTEAQIKAKTELAQKETERKEQQTEVDKLDKELKELKEERKEAPVATQEELDKRIAERQADLAERQARIKRIDEAMAALQAGIDKATQELGKLTKEQQDQAGSLREMQMKMIEKTEAYEKERRTQAAELVRINALLKGQQTEDETLQLAVQSLNLSIGALKRMKEIIQELAFFFQSFADFMGAVADDAARLLANLERADNGTLRANAMRNLGRNIDVFFLKQTAEWLATGKVAGLFNQSFADGWSHLNKLSGTYLHGEELTAYLKEAGNRLTEISQERERRATARIADLQTYREELQRQAVKPDAAELQAA